MWELSLPVGLVRFEVGPLVPRVRAVDAEKLLICLYDRSHNAVLTVLHVSCAARSACRTWRCVRR